MTNDKMIQEMVEIAKKAGEAILGFYDEEIVVDYKSDDSPLTKADLAAHHVIVDGLKKLDNTIPIISEESGVPEYGIRKEWKTYFLVDPLDGTKEFIKKNGEFTVNIALLKENVPVLGVVYLPAKDITYYSGKDIGAFKQIGSEDAKAISFNKFNKENEASIVVSRSHGGDDTVQKLNDLGIKVKKEIPSGSSIKLCLVAEGVADLYPRFGPTMEWDTAAGDCIYRYACSDGYVESSIKYNKPNMLNDEFILGL